MHELKYAPRSPSGCGHNQSNLMRSGLGNNADIMTDTDNDEAAACTKNNSLNVPFIHIKTKMYYVLSLDNAYNIYCIWGALLGNIFWNLTNECDLHSEICIETSFWRFESQTTIFLKAQVNVFSKRKKRPYRQGTLQAKKCNHGFKCLEWTPVVLLMKGWNLHAIPFPFPHYTIMTINFDCNNSKPGCCSYRACKWQLGVVVSVYMALQQHCRENVKLLCSCFKS